MEQSITFIGLDVHKETISVAFAEGGERGEARVYGEIANRPDALRRLISRLARDGHEPRFCYEAGPCGYGIQRQLTDAGHDCVVAAPALIPRRPGDRIKTNRRDALKLARLHRAGESFRADYERSICGQRSHFPKDQRALPRRDSKNSVRQRRT